MVLGSRILLPICIFLILLLLLGGCSDSPVAPGNVSGMTASDIPGSVQSSHTLLGYNILKVDTTNGEIEVIPVRSAEFHFNLVSVLNTTMGVSVQGVPSEHDAPNGIFVFDITLTHPFGTKPNLSGFDVKGIFISDGDAELNALNIPSLSDTRLVNADGYTRWWNPTEFTKSGLLGYTEGNLGNASTDFTAEINGYKLFADRLGPTDSMLLVSTEPMDSDMGRAVFTAGAENTRRYIIKFKMDPGPQVYFGYAIDACWAAPVPNPPVQVPDDFPIVANQPEPYCLSITELANSMFYNSENGNNGGTLALQIDVYDWQGQLAGDFSQEFASPTLFAPGLINNWQFSTLISSDENYSTYKFVNYNVPTIPLAEGTYPVYFSIDSEDGSKYKQFDAPGPDQKLESFQMIEVEVVDPECLTDDNNSSISCPVLEYHDYVVDGLCGSVDPADYYKFTIPTGNMFKSGLAINSTIPGTKWTIHNDGDGNIKAVESESVIGWAYLGEQGEYFGAGNYYITVETTDQTANGLYCIETNIELEPFEPTGATEVTPDNLACEATWMGFGFGLVILSNDRHVWAYDVSFNPDFPMFKSRVDVTMSGDPVLHGSYLYYYETNGSDFSTLRMIDFTDNENPIHHEYVTESASVFECLAIDDDYLYIAERYPVYRRVRINDWPSLPTSPPHIGNVALSFDSSVKDMEVIHPFTDKKSIVVMGTLSMNIANIYNPAVPVMNVDIDQSGGFLNKYIAVDGNNIITVVYNPYADDHLLSVLDFADGVNLTNLGIEALGFLPSAMGAYSNKAFASDGPYIKKYDYTDPGNIDKSNFTNARATLIFLEPIGGGLFGVIQRFYAPRTANILLGVDPEWHYEMYRFANNPYDSVIVQDHMYVQCRRSDANHNGSVELTNPLNANIDYMRSMAAYVDHFFGNQRILSWARANDQIYWASPSGGNFTGEAYENLGQYITSITASNQYLYVAVKDPTQFKMFYIQGYPDIEPIPQIDKSISYRLDEMLIYDDMLLGYTDEGHIRTWDITDGNNPWEKGAFGPLVSDMKDWAARDGYLFVLLEDQIQIYDISTWIPDFITAIGLPYTNMEYMKLHEQYAIVGSPDQHPVFIDITDPESPVSAGAPISGSPLFPIRNIDAKGNFLYELCDSHGVRIFELY